MSVMPKDSIEVILAFNAWTGMTDIGGSHVEQGAADALRGLLL